MTKETDFRRSERTFIDPNTGNDIMAMLNAKQPLIASESRLIFNGLVKSFASSDKLDPALVVLEFSRYSPHIAALFGADIGLYRPALLSEHTEADFGGFLQDYRELFKGDPEAVKILGLASLLKDSGKSLCVQQKGTRQAQSFYNKLVTDNILTALDEETLADDAKKVVALLVEQDSIGNALQGSFDQAALDELRADFPPRFADRFDDFLIASFLSDASAHTSYRTYTNMATGEILPAVSQNDEAEKKTLTHLFEVPIHGNPLRLAQPYRRIVSAILPHQEVTRDLMKDGPLTDIPEKQAASVYIDEAQAEDIWSATFSFELTPYEDVKTVLETYANETRFPISALVSKRKAGVTEVTLMRCPSAQFGTAPQNRYEELAKDIKEKLGWKRVHEQTQDDRKISAYVGYNNACHKPFEAIDVLSHYLDTSWKTEPTHLISARLEDNKYVLDDQPVMRIIGSGRSRDTIVFSEMDQESTPQSLAAILAVANHFGQKRIFVEDYKMRKTYTFGATLPENMK